MVVVTPRQWLPGELDEPEWQEPAKPAEQPMPKEWAAWLASVLAPTRAPLKTSDWNAQDHVISLLARGDRDIRIINLRQAWTVQWLTAVARREESAAIRRAQATEWLVTVAGRE